MVGKPDVIDSSGNMLCLFLFKWKRKHALQRETCFVVPNE